MDKVQGSFFVWPDRRAVLDDDLGVDLCYSAATPFVADNPRE